MKFLINIVVLSLFIIPAKPVLSQSKRKKSEINNVEFVLNIKKKERIKVKNFGSIRIYDCRPDSNALGYVYFSTPENLSYINFPGSASVYLTQELNNSIISSANKNELIILLNDLWLGSGDSENGKSLTNLYLNTSFILKTGNEHKQIGNLDSIFSKPGWLGNNFEGLFEEALLASLITADNWIGSNPTPIEISDDDLDFMRIKNKSLPILNSSSYNKGIYFSFEDFVQNKPVDTYFDVEEFSRYNKLIYDSIRYNLKQPWGYCDGQDVYMHLEKYYYKIQRVNNRFEVSAPFSYEVVNTFAKRLLSSTAKFAAAPRGGKIIAAEPFFRPRVEQYSFYRLYQLNLLTGILRLTY